MKVTIIAAIIIGVIIAIVMGTISYQSEYDQNCTAENGKVTGFLRCTVIYEDFTEPEDESTHVDESKLMDAMKKLQEIYTLDSSLGPFTIKDVIVGYGISGDLLVVDVLAKYYESDHLELIKQKIQDIVGSEVNVVFSSSEAIVPTTDCHGNAQCFSGTVTKIIDGDTLKVMNGSTEKSIRFALASAPEISNAGGISARDHVAKICPVGSIAIIDEDDLQTQGSYGRVIAQIHCNGVNLNESILEADLGEISSEFCSKSEFALESWAIKFGCN